MNDSSLTYIDALLAKSIQSSFAPATEADMPRIPYRERIQGQASATYRLKKQHGGELFAEIALHVEPLEPNPRRADPLEFVSAIGDAVVSRSFWPAIEKGVREAMAQGIVSGNPLYDVRVMIYDGKEHPVDSREIAFKIAGQRAFHAAARKAHVAVTEPVCLLTITLPSEAVGAVVADLSANKRSRIIAMENSSSGRTLVSAYVPLLEYLHSASNLRSMIQRRGDLTVQFDHYADLPADLAQKLLASAPRLDDA